MQKRYKSWSRKFFKAELNNSNFLKLFWTFWSLSSYSSCKRVERKVEPRRTSFVLRFSFFFSSFLSSRLILEKRWPFLQKERLLYYHKNFNNIAANELNFFVLFCIVFKRTIMATLLSKIWQNYFFSNSTENSIVIVFSTSQFEKQSYFDVNKSGLALFGDFCNFLTISMFSDKKAWNLEQKSKHSEFFKFCDKTFWIFRRKSEF